MPFSPAGSIPSSRALAAGYFRAARIRRRWLRHACAIACLAGALVAGTSTAQSVVPPETVLIRRGDVIVTRADLELDMEKLPAERRPEFLEDERSVRTVLERLLTARELAQRGRDSKLVPEAELSGKNALEQEKLLAAVYVASVIYEAGQRFDARKAELEPRVREIYLITKERYKSADGYRSFDEAKESILTGMRAAELDRAQKAIYDELRGRLNEVSINEAALRAMKSVDNTAIPR